MTMPTIFKSEVGNILLALASAAENRGPDYYDALRDVAVALGIQYVRPTREDRVRQIIQERREP